MVLRAALKGLTVAAWQCWGLNPNHWTLKPFSKMLLSCRWDTKNCKRIYVYMWSLKTKCPRQLKQFLTCSHPSAEALQLKALFSWPALVGYFPPAKAKYYLKSPCPGRITPWSLSLNLRPGLAPYHPLGFQVKLFFFTRLFLS